jgi:hypothetical protein
LNAGCWVGVAVKANLAVITEGNIVSSDEGNDESSSPWNHIDKFASRPVSYVSGVFYLTLRTGGDIRKSEKSESHLYRLESLKHALANKIEANRTIYIST